MKPSASALFSGEGWALGPSLDLGTSREVRRVEADHPEGLDSLLRYLDEVASSGNPDLIAVGFFTYEAGVWLTGSQALFRPPEVTPLALFALFDRRQAPEPGDDIPIPLASVGSVGPDLSREGWRSGVTAIREGIERGDVYQVNLTRRIRLAESVPPRWLASALFAENPVPYAVTIATEDFAVVSNSPELFLEVDLAEGRVFSAPIKGTAARGPSGPGDETARASLLASEKDAAEHIMIVDLIRNDLGRVAVPGGVSVADLRRLRSFRHVHHLESTVRARLSAGMKLSDILRATLPGGSITGAPKRASLRFIRELEPSARGPYTGAAGYVRGNGQAVFNVAIRTAILSCCGTDYHTGGGIVWDSDENAEWEETVAKSQEFFGVFQSPEAPGGWENG